MPPPADFAKRPIHFQHVAPNTLDADLRLTDLTGLPLFGMGGNASELQGDDYVPTQAWSAAVYYRPEVPNDGIYYQSRYINTNPAVAIFDHGGQRVNLCAIETMPLLDHPDLGRALDSMNAVIVPTDP